MAECLEQTKDLKLHIFLNSSIPAVHSSSQYSRTATQDSTADAAIGDKFCGRKLLLWIKHWELLPSSWVFQQTMLSEGITTLMAGALFSVPDQTSGLHSGESAQRSFQIKSVFPQFFYAPSHQLQDLHRPQETQLHGTSPIQNQVLAAAVVLQQRNYH